MKKLVLAVLCALLATGCGTTGKSDSEKAAEQRASSAARAAEEATALFRECSELTGDLDEEVSGINSRLSTGMQFEEYTSKVGDAVAARDRAVKKIESDGMSDECLSSVATPLENAMLALAKGGDIWNECIQDYNCSFDEGSDALTRTQKQWTKADNLVTKAEGNLEALRP